MYLYIFIYIYIYKIFSEGPLGPLGVFGVSFYIIWKFTVIDQKV